MEQLSLMRLLVLMEIIETGGFGSAAERLNLTQPAVSFHVRALERIFGTRLFQDPRRGVELTGSGKMIYELARKTVQHTRVVMQDVKSVTAGERGRLIVGASSAVGDRMLPQAIAAYHQEFPDVEVVLRVNSSKQICQQVLDGEIDAGVVMGPAVLPGLESAPIYVEEAVFITDPDHPLQALSHVKPQDLIGTPIVISPSDSVHYLILNSWLRSNGITKYRVAAEIQSVGGIVTAVQSRLGISALFRTTIHHPLQTGAIRILDVANSPIPVSAHFLVRVGRPPSPLLDRFREFVYDWVTTQEEIAPVPKSGG